MDNAQKVPGGWDEDFDDDGHVEASDHVVAGQMLRGWNGNDRQGLGLETGRMPGSWHDGGDEMDLDVPVPAIQAAVAISNDQAGEVPAEVLHGPPANNDVAPGGVDEAAIEDLATGRDVEAVQQAEPPRTPPRGNEPPVESEGDKMVLTPQRGREEDDALPVGSPMNTASDHAGSPKSNPAKRPKLTASWPRP